MDQNAAREALSICTVAAAELLRVGLRTQRCHHHGGVRQLAREDPARAQRQHQDGASGDRRTVSGRVPSLDVRDSTGRRTHGATYASGNG